MLAALFGVVTGFVVASGADRFTATHELNASGQDAPAQGDVYNSEAVSLPIWTSWKRLVAAVASIGVPIGFAAYVKSPAWKSFWQLAGFGAIARTGGKAGDDAIGYAVQSFMPTNATLVRLYSPEIASATRQAQSALTAPAAATPATFAGLTPKQLGQITPQQAQQYAINAAANAAIPSDSQGNCPPGYQPYGEGSCIPTPPAPPISPPAPPGPPMPPSPPAPPMSPPPAPPTYQQPPLSPQMQSPFNPLTACPENCNEGYFGEEFR